ncbi:hypothetical protein RN001_015695 [Aquatica leii]|uniref:SLC41A/MgtE integral membrane domain-containing protein n=1 Tax=Aquatica leii TaxID=1421715 RepID=A0AAN7NYD5_9COLE|nr:hypothetical protein RN001_015695 [Aquatica leii]
MVVRSSFCKDGCYADLEHDVSNNPNGNTVAIITSEDNILVSTIFGIDDHIQKTHGDLEGVKVESLPDLKSIDSIESIKSLESIKSSDANANLDEEHEKWYSVTLQVLVPFMIAGFGTIGAGLVLGNIEKEEVFNKVDSLYILVPAIIGLKGNLDMCLATRLSTAANVGHMENKREIFKMFIGNVGLVQVQAIVAAIVVSMYAVCISALIMDRRIDIESIMFVTCCSVLTATISCFVLDFVLTGVIVTTYKTGMNPDNFATSLAASIGDVVSLTVLSLFAKNLYKLHGEFFWMFYVITGVYVFIILPIWILIVLKNKYTKTILTDGWVPVLSALFISGMGGLILDQAVGQFRGFVVFQPIVNGVGGNLASVHISRMSTMLQKSSLPGIIPPHTKLWVWPWTALITGVLSAKTARILILMSVPGHTVFVLVADVIYNRGALTVTPSFVCTYLTISILQIIMLLYISHLVTHLLWKFKINPDNAAIPYLTALGDLLGSSFLLVAFMFLEAVGQQYRPVV